MTTIQVPIVDATQIGVDELLLAVETSGIDLADDAEEAGEWLVIPAEGDPAEVAASLATLAKKRKLTVEVSGDTVTMKPQALPWLRPLLIGRSRENRKLTQLCSDLSADPAWQAWWERASGGSVGLWFHTSDRDTFAEGPVAWSHDGETGSNAQIANLAMGPNPDAEAGIKTLLDEAADHFGEPHPAWP